MKDNLHVLCINVCREIIENMRKKTPFISEIVGDFEPSLDNIIKDTNTRYDLVVVNDMFDYFSNFQEVLSKARKCLNQQGHLLIFDKNRLAIHRFGGSIEQWQAIEEFCQA